MSLNNGLVTIVLPLLLASSFPLSYLDAQKVKGIKPGKTYTSPLKNFAVVAPEFCLGTKIQQQNDKTGGMVAFLSDAGQLDRIDYQRLNPDLATAIDQADSAERLALYAEVLNSVTLQPSGATLLVKEPITFQQSEALFAVAEFPGGSVLAELTFADGKATPVRKDSVRGLMVFVKGEFVYVLHHEVGIDFDTWFCDLRGQGGPQLTPEERDHVAREGLQRLYATIAFK